VNPGKSCHPVQYHVYPVRQDERDTGEDFRMGRDERDFFWGGREVLKPNYFIQ
jgi:hypothetical protein